MLGRIQVRLRGVLKFHIWVYSVNKKNRPQSFYVTKHPPLHLNSDSSLPPVTRKLAYKSCGSAQLDPDSALGLPRDPNPASLKIMRKMVYKNHDNSLK